MTSRDQDGAPVRHRRRARRRISAVRLLMSVLALLGGCTAMGGGAAVLSDQLRAEYAARQNRTVPGRIGTPVTNAGMTYLVKTVAVHTSLLGDAGQRISARTGTVLVVVGVELTNTGEAPRAFLEKSVEVVTPAGARYGTVPGAADSLDLAQIRAGRPFGGSLTFEMPAGALAGASLIVRDVWGDGRVTVPLRR